MTKNDERKKTVLFEDFFTSMLNSVTESAFLIDLDGVVLAANDMMGRRMGFSRGEDLVGRNVYDLLPPEVAAIRRARAEEVVSTGEPVQFEDERSGRYFFNSIYPDFDSSCKVSRLSVFAMDITRQKTHEERLSLFGEMVDRAPASITIHDTEGNFIYANRETLRLHGYTEKEFMALNLRDLDVPESVELLEERFRMIVEKGELSFESAHFHRDGSVIPLLVLTKSLDWKGTPAVMSIATDIRERKRAEQILRESEERFRLLSEVTMEGIVIQKDGIAVDVNSAVLRTLGYDREELLGKNLMELAIYEEDRGKIQEDLVKEYAGPCVSRVVKKNGDVFWAEIEARNIDLDGEVIRVAALRDIRDRKKAEDDLKDALGRLRRVTGSVIQVIVMAVESRDPYTAGHQRRVGDLARAIATEMGLSPHDVEGIRIAGVIHDLGKISVPSEILSKPRKLNDTEFAIVKEHPQKGYDILKDVDFDWPVAEMVLQHHERLDGSGYPGGLKNGEILLQARILAVADVVEAMASHRPYRPTLGLEAALEEITANRGALYEPEAVEACLRLFREKGYRMVE